MGGKEKKRRPVLLLEACVEAWQSMWVPGGVRNGGDSQLSWDAVAGDRGRVVGRHAALVAGWEARWGKINMNHICTYKLTPKGQGWYFCKNYLKTTPT